jgi:hypothetical protein
MIFYRNMCISKHESDHFEENLAKIKQIFLSISQIRIQPGQYVPDRLRIHNTGVNFRPQLPWYRIPTHS